MYAKIFEQIFDSSIAEDPETRFTFMDMLILANKDGVVDMTHEAIARRTNRPLDLIRATIKKLEQPDKRSRTPDADGRRLRKLDEHRDWGWVIVNYDRFRDIGTEMQRQEKTRERVKKYREKLRKKDNVTPCNAPVTLSNACNDSVTHVYAGTVVGTGTVKELSTKAKGSLKEVTEFCLEIGLAESDGVYFFNKCEGNGWINNKQPIRDWRATIRAWKAAGYMPSQKERISKPLSKEQQINKAIANKEIESWMRNIKRDQAQSQ